MFPRAHGFTRRLALLALAITVLLAGCGSSGVSATAWVNSVCTGVAPFFKGLRTSDSALSSGTYETAAQEKQAIEGFVSGAVAGSQRALSAVKAAGTPEVPNGKAVEAAFIKGFAGTTAALSKWSAGIDSLPTSSPEAFKAAGQPLLSAFQSAMGRLGSSFDGLKSGELEAAAKKNAACGGLKALLAS